ncbi:MFS transporter [Streptomyces sp. XM83C]|uniref:MFS transporter n=1 Tax=Streptomyces thermocoprophilus TaxID=78356 RepID=A0ABV5VCY2_9ACTN|nr:MFS transporter [Streptomyces sp. XM83C]MCK1822493.1 MFS transporter [Streptomyces sp. XM83C]
MTADQNIAASDETGIDRRRSASAFWRYWTGSTVSGVGDAITTVALPLMAVSVLGASSLEVSFLTAAQYAAWIAIGLPAGVIVQRLPLRGTQVAMDLIRAAAVLSVPVAYALDVLHLAHLVLVALVLGLATVVFDVGNSSFLPSIVSKDELTARNSLTSASASATQLGGPSLGGVLVQFCGAAFSLVLDAVSYVISAVLLRSLPRPERTRPEAERQSTVQLIKEGWRFVVHHPVIRPCVAAATLTNFICGAFMALLPVFLVRTLDAPAGLVGVLIATEGIGSLIGAALTPKLVQRIGGARTILCTSLLGSTAALLMPLSDSGWGYLLFGLGNIGFGCGVVVLSILTRTHRQTVTPPELLPRVMATVRFVSWGAVPFGALTAGASAGLLGNRGALWLICALAFLAPAALWTSPLRRMRDLT